MSHNQFEAQVVRVWSGDQIVCLCFCCCLFSCLLIPASHSPSLKKEQPKKEGFNCHPSVPQGKGLEVLMGNDADVGVNRNDTPSHANDAKEVRKLNAISARVLDH